MDGNLLTFLQHKSNIKYNIFLSKIKNRIYEPVITLSAEVLKSREPIDFTAIHSSQFQPIKSGEKWGRFFDCAWFRFQGELPKSIDRENLCLRIEVGGEGCVYNENGVVQGFTNVLGMVDNFQTAKGKQIIPLSSIGNFSDGHILFYADCGNNGKGGKSTCEARFKRAQICIVNYDLIDVYYDFLVCFQALYAVDSSSKKKALKRILNKAIGEFSFSSKGVLYAKNILKEAYDEKEKEDFTVYAEGHGHLDLAWLWPVRETKRKAVRTFSNALYEAKRFPEYVFNGSQPQQYDFIKEKSPELLAMIKEGVKAGNIEPQGGMWVEPDTNLPCGESLIAQCYYGKKFFKDEFGVDVKTLWLPDVFGYTSALPQIIKKCGMDNFMTIKLSWNNINKFPYHTFNWSGLDDSAVLVHMPPQGDYNSNANPYAFFETFSSYREKSVSDKALMSFGIGDGGGGPGEYHIESVKRCQKLRYIPKVKVSSSSEFFEDLSKDKEKYPFFKGELYLEKHQGTFTTQANTKKNNRICEMLLHRVKFLGVLAAKKGYKFPFDKIEEIEKEILLYQFHDVLPGSSIERVYSESNARYEIIKNKLNCFIDSFLEVLKNDENGLSAVNTSPVDIDGIALIDGEKYKYCVKPYSSAKLIKCEKKQITVVENNTLENQYLKVKIAPDGSIESFVTKNRGKEYVGGDFAKLLVYKDKFVHPYNAWDIDIKYTKKKPKSPALVSSKVYCDEVSAICENHYKFNKSTFVQKLIVKENEPFMRVECSVDWHETHKMLRLNFEPTVWSNEVLCDIQFGNIKRSTKTDNSIDYAQFEIPAHKWVDISDGKNGIAVVNDCKYGHRVKDGLISVNCLRSTVYPDKTADRGHHTFAFAVYPHQGEALNSKLVNIGYAFNNPVIIKSGEFDVNMQIALSNDNQIITETVMFTQGGKTAFRMYETKGREAEIALPFTENDIQIYESDLLFQNRKLLSNGTIKFKPFEIKTIII